MFDFEIPEIDYDYYMDEEEKPTKNKKQNIMDPIQALLYLGNSNKLKKSKNFKLKKYQKIQMYVYDRSILNRIFDELKIKDVGNIYDYDEFPVPETFSSGSIMDYSLVNRIGISKKNSILVLYNKSYYSIDCTFLVSVKKLKKFTEITSKIVLDDSQNVLKGEDFTCGPKTYIELSDSMKDSTKMYNIVRKYIPDEQLVFDDKSTIYKVKKDILSFFTKKTEDIYEKLGLPFKRGIILYGDPGNGKSAIIREIIRTTDSSIIKVVIKGVKDLVSALSCLTAELNGKQAIIIMEDIDSMINEFNRSDLLNILDGVEIKSGLFMIGTTNYPERLDPAFMNRAGRFDKTYKIGNPSKEARRLYFENRKISQILSDFKLRKNYKGTDKEIIKTFVKYSDKLPMASLKELLTNVSYMLIYEEEKYIEDAVKKAYSTIVDARENHMAMHESNTFNNMAKLPKSVAMAMGMGATIVNSPTVYNSNDDIDDDTIDDIINKKVVKIRKIK